MQGCIKTLFTVSLLVFTLAPQQEAAARHRSSRSNPIPNFVNSAPGMYRGGHPGMQGLLYLKALGVKTIVNLESSDSTVGEEMKQAQALGMRELSYPMTGFTHTEEDSVNGALAALADPNLYPIFVHC